MKKFLCALSACILIPALKSDKAEASRIKVVNENLSSLYMEIIPEDYSRETVLCKKNVAGSCAAPGRNFGDFLVTSEDLRGRKYFAVTGMCGSIIFKGTCRNLSVSKNYKIRFLSDSLGTTCVAEEVTPALFSTVFIVRK